MAHRDYVIAYAATACVAPMGLIIGILYLTIREDNFMSTTLNGAMILLVLKDVS
jgi:zinc transporter ZupT